MSPERAAALLDDMRMLRLDVILVPSRRPEEAKRGAMIRCVICPNPDWYSRLCTAHQKRRTKPRRSSKPDTRIVRRDVERLLTRAADGKPCRSYILDWIEKNV